jgi:hypothetical protein
MKEMPRKSAAELEAECLRLLTYLCGLRVEPASPARPDLWQGRSAIARTRSMHRRTAMS